MKNQQNNSYKGTAIVFSIISIILFFIKVSPNSIVDSNTYISCLVSIMALVFTLLIGYQIYNALDIQKKMREIDILNQKMNRIKDELEHKVESTSEHITSLQCLIS